jgi:hypothetical protein
VIDYSADFSTTEAGTWKQYPEWDEKYRKLNDEILLPILDELYGPMVEPEFSDTGDFIYPEPPAGPEEQGYSVEAYGVWNAWFYWDTIV